ncbi:MAG: enoyl-CoA hydratase-related protein [Arenicellales bacterium]|nr:enoyl-CoA hydratase-related protein [Arenicellales bacterium]
MTVHYEIVEHVAQVTIDRPELLNAVDQATEDEMQRIWREIEGRSDIWCVVLTGAGERCFSSGADVQEAVKIGRSGFEYWSMEREGGFGGIATRLTLNVPVIARVNGGAYGGGFEMVMGADIVVAADHAKFGLTEPRLGFLPLDGGMVMLPRLIPAKHAMGMLMTGRRVTADELAGFGLINEVVPMAELDDAVTRWVDQIKLCSPRSIRAIKQVVRNTSHLAPYVAMGQRLPALMESLNGPDSDEGSRAFVEKRTPNWPE